MILYCEQVDYSLPNNKMQIQLNVNNWMVKIIGRKNSNWGCGGCDWPFYHDHAYCVFELELTHLLERRLIFLSISDIVSCFQMFSVQKCSKIFETQCFFKLRVNSQKLVNTQMLVDSLRGCPILIFFGSLAAVKITLCMFLCVVVFHG